MMRALQQRNNYFRWWQTLNWRLEGWLSEVESTMDSCTRQGLDKISPKSFPNLVLYDTRVDICPLRDARFTENKYLLKGAQIKNTKLYQMFPLCFS